MPRAIEAYKWLHEQPSFEVILLSAPSVRNPLSYTEKRNWVVNHLGLEAAERLIISCHKGLNLGDYLIDDHISGKGQEDFQGQILHFGSKQFPDWEKVVRFFEAGGI